MKKIFQGIFETCKRSLIIAFSICMTVPLNFVGKSRLQQKMLILSKLWLPEIKASIGIIIFKHDLKDIR